MNKDRSFDARRITAVAAVAAGFALSSGSEINASPIENTTPQGDTPTLLVEDGSDPHTIYMTGGNTNPEQPVFQQNPPSPDTEDGETGPDPLTIHSLYSLELTDTETQELNNILSLQGINAADGVALSFPEGTLFDAQDGSALSRHLEITQQYLDQITQSGGNAQFMIITGSATGETEYATAIKVTTEFTGSDGSSFPEGTIISVNPDGSFNYLSPVSEDETIAVIQVTPELSQYIVGLGFTPPDVGEFTMGAVNSKGQVTTIITRDTAITVAPGAVPTPTIPTPAPVPVPEAPTQTGQGEETEPADADEDTEGPPLSPEQYFSPTAEPGVYRLTPEAVEILEGMVKTHFPDDLFPVPLGDNILETYPNLYPDSRREVERLKTYFGTQNIQDASGYTGAIGEQEVGGISEINGEPYLYLNVYTPAASGEMLMRRIYLGRLNGGSTIRINAFEGPSEWGEYLIPNDVEGARNLIETLSDGRLHQITGLVMIGANPGSPHLQSHTKWMAEVGADNFVFIVQRIQIT